MAYSISKGRAAKVAETIENIEKSTDSKSAKPSAAQMRYLARGINQPGGKLPLFDLEGQRIKEKTIRSCITHGWCEVWFRNPVDPNWLVCKLTDTGRSVAGNR